MTSFKHKKSRISAAWKAFGVTYYSVTTVENPITASARQLHVHQNTIKYRLSVVANTLGVHPSKMPDNFALYQGIAVRRLLKP